MTILDQEIKEFKEEVAPKRRLPYFEIIVGAATLGVVMLRDILGDGTFYEAILTISIVPALGYLFAFYWIDKPQPRNARTVIVTILYGVAFSAMAFAFIFLNLFLYGGGEMVELAVIAFAAAFVIDIVTSVDKRKVATNRTLVRLAVFVVILGILYFTPQDVRVNFSYRRDTEFLESYEENKHHKSFERIQAEYAEFKKIKTILTK